MLQVAVKLPAAIDNVGEYLAEVTALEAAGAHTIWVGDTELEPWVVLGAMAAVTHRVRLGCHLSSTATWPLSRLGPAVATVMKLSRGRIVVWLPIEGDQVERAAALQAAGAKVYTTGSQAKPADGVIVNVESADQLSGAREADIELWAAIAVPADRDAWARALSDYDAAGVFGVIVPWSVRVLDLLRNPEPDDRTDLLISTG